MRHEPTPAPSTPVSGAEHAYDSFAGTFTYSSYLHLEELLGAQVPVSDAHDETLFITIHHVQEVWMSLIIVELERAMARLTAGDFAPAMKMLTRVARAQDQMGNAWEVLKTMTPSDYLEFRGALGRASGFQSWQYRTIEFLLGNRQRYLLRPFAEHPRAHARLSAILDAPSVYDIALQALANHGLLSHDALRTTFDTLPTSQPHVRAAWLAVYRDPASHWDLYYLAEKLVDVEDNFRRWRFNHLTTVERLIGHKTGTGGTTGAGYLRKALDIVLFPELWEVRTEL